MDGDIGQEHSPVMGFRAEDISQLNHGIITDEYAQNLMIVVVVGDLARHIEFEWHPYPLYVTAFTASITSATLGSASFSRLAA